MNKVYGSKDSEIIFSIFVPLEANHCFDCRDVQTLQGLQETDKSRKAQQLTTNQPSSATLDSVQNSFSHLILITAQDQFKDRVVIIPRVNAGEVTERARDSLEKAFNVMLSLFH